MPGKHHRLLNQICSGKILETSILLALVTAEIFNPDYCTGITCTPTVAGPYEFVFVFYHMEQGRVLLQQIFYHVRQRLCPIIAWPDSNGCRQHQWKDLKVNHFGSTEGRKIPSQPCGRREWRMRAAYRFYRKDFLSQTQVEWTYQYKGNLALHYSPS